ncbi:MAG: hypothetical protein C0599_08770 [Salinivirgaceae bacterium]|nr:MAG: hypothetical protein C0599_08770 [Salinivirgaceae bacterium]
MKNAVVFVFLLISISVFAEVDSLRIQEANEKLAKSNEYFYANTDSAIYFARQSFFVGKEINHKQIMVSANIMIGILQYSRNRFDSALYYYNLAEKAYDSSMDSLILIKIQANRSNVFIETNQSDKAIELLLFVKKYFENKHDTLNTGRVYGTLANIFLIKDKYDDAIKHYKEAIKCFEPLDYKVGLGLSSQNIGIIYLDKKIYDTAKIYLGKAKTIFKSQKMLHALAEVNANFATIAFRNGDVDSALYFIDKSIEFFESNDAFQDLISSNISKAQYLSKQGSYVKSIHLLKKSEHIAEERELLDLLSSIYKNLYELYTDMGIESQSLYYIEKYAAINDSLNNLRLQSREDELLIEYNVAQKEKDFEILKIKDNLNRKIISKQHNVMILMGFIGLLLLFLAYSLYNRFTVKNKANKLLEEKNEEIKSQAEEIISQNEVLQQQKENLTDSINYARFIQKTILNPRFEDSLKYFTFNQPKDIVSGDFFWNNSSDNYHYLAVADCTGHGVPGAFMSVLSFTFLNEIFTHNPEIGVAEMLENLREKIKEALHQSEDIDASKDGLDIGLIRLNKKDKEVEFAGAYRPCWIFDGNIFIELKGDKQPIGIYPHEKPFSIQKYKPEGYCKIYLFTDGLTDQISGEGKKFKISGLKDFLNEIHQNDISEQEMLIKDKYKELTFGSDQIDDVLIAGIEY